MQSATDLVGERGVAGTSLDDVRRRAIITQLMCNFFVDLGQNGQVEFAPELARLRELQEKGLVNVRGVEVDVTPLGRIFVRNIASVFDAYLNGGKNAFSRAV